MKEIFNSIYRRTSNDNKELKQIETLFLHTVLCFQLIYGLSNHHTCCMLPETACEVFEFEMLSASRRALSNIKNYDGTTDTRPSKCNTHPGCCSQGVCHTLSLAVFGET